MLFLTSAAAAGRAAARPRARSAPPSSRARKGRGALRVVSIMGEVSCSLEDRRILPQYDRRGPGVTAETPWAPRSRYSWRSERPSGGPLRGLARLSMARRPITDDLDLLLDVLPPAVQAALAGRPDLDRLLEVVLDLGRRPEARFPARGEDLGEEPVSRGDIAHVVDRVGRFGGDNRAGIERTLHRISALRNRRGDVIGL